MRTPLTVSRCETAQGKLRTEPRAEILTLSTVEGEGPAKIEDDEYGEGKI